MPACAKAFDVQSVEMLLSLKSTDRTKSFIQLWSDFLELNCKVNTSDWKQLFENFELLALLEEVKIIGLQMKQFEEKTDLVNKNAAEFFRNKLVSLFDYYKDLEDITAMEESLRSELSDWLNLPTNEVGNFMKAIEVLKTMLKEVMSELSKRNKERKTSRPKILGIN